MIRISASYGISAAAAAAAAGAAAAQLRAGVAGGAAVGSLRLTGSQALRLSTVQRSAAQPHAPSGPLLYC
jgi:hypothetical protein